LAEKILMAHKRRVGALELVPSDGGVFEVSVNGKLIYSKKQTGEFPDFDAVVKQLKVHA
jgi:selenoprotein W-related protein